jgi:phosphotriesterase-related protein
MRVSSAILSGTRTKPWFAAAALGIFVLSLGCRSTRPGTVMTVTGPIRAADMGVTLPHEHVLVDFTGADGITEVRYDPDSAASVILPHLIRLRNLGCGTLVECTPAFLGRDPALLRRLSIASGMTILTNTGYYAAMDNRYLPLSFYREDADRIARRWTDEWRHGIGGTGVRPGFIKIGVPPGPLSVTHRKLVRAAARTHLRTGLTIASHTGPAAGAFDQIEILREEGVDPSAWIWVHAQAEGNPGALVTAARLGAWISIDNIGWVPADSLIPKLEILKDRGCLGRVLLSQDAGWYSVGRPGGGKYRGHDAIFTEFLPALEKAGFSAAEIRAMMRDNPAAAFEIRVRRPGFAPRPAQ